MVNRGLALLDSFDRFLGARTSATDLLMLADEAFSRDSRRMRRVYEECIVPLAEQRASGSFERSNTLFSVQPHWSKVGGFALAAAAAFAKTRDVPTSMSVGVCGGLLGLGESLVRERPTPEEIATAKFYSLFDHG